MTDSLSLPPEILCTIFVELQPKKRLRHQLPVEVVVSHVCKHWRGAAIGFPQLWSRIDVYSDKSQDRLAGYLERSNPCLVDVNIDTYDFDNGSNSLDEVASFAHAFELIAKHIERVKRLFWFTRYENTIEQYRNPFMNVAAPQLEHLRIVATKHIVPYKRSGPSYTIFNGGAPLLNLVDIGATWTLPCIEHLTTLILGDICPPFDGLASQFLRIITSAPNLQNLAIHRTFGTATTDIMTGPISMPNLRSLKLAFQHTSLIVSFLFGLQAPLLESLWLSCRPFMALYPFLKHAQVASGTKFPRLKYLTLQTYDFPECSLFARAFSTVRCLHLLYPRNSLLNLDELFGMSSSQYVYWPSVDTLAIQSTHDAYTSNNFVNQLHGLIHYRRQVDKKIKNFLFDSDLFEIVSRDENICRNVTVETLHGNNYDEYWWNLDASQYLQL
ncbi:hypothetical protein AMATHDRAFT_140863 [Amanita thiersii Skay4041]|uniref:F-box domain-containing protein n=1 Tax=Amanita thiersii Skay4041 TaxID=703135 RepID=A0A2A9NWQ2_9AGAR|nr:hypothetical protein AMATHDRAFT_140863 [Amanita thiersii Skay4041]